MGKKRRSGDKSSMRRTPENKMRRIGKAIAACEAAQLKYETDLDALDADADAREALEYLLRRVKAHIQRLQERMSFWRKGGDR